MRRVGLVGSGRSVDDSCWRGSNVFPGRCRHKYAARRPMKTMTVTMISTSWWRLKNVQCWFCVRLISSGSRFVDWLKGGVVVVVVGLRAPSQPALFLIQRRWMVDSDGAGPDDDEYDRLDYIQSVLATRVRIRPTPGDSPEFLQKILHFLVLWLNEWSISLR